MTATTDHSLSLLRLRVNSSPRIGAVGLHSFLHDMFLDWDLVRVAGEGRFFRLTAHSSLRLSTCGLSLRVLLRSFYGVLLCRRIPWVRRSASERSSQRVLFLLHQYALMSSSLGMPTCSSSMSKLTFFDTRYAAWINLVSLIYPITYENSGCSCASVFSVVKTVSICCGKMPRVFNSKRSRLLKSNLNLIMSGQFQSLFYWTILIINNLPHFNLFYQ